MRGLGLIIYGVEGIGKTSFSLQLPKPLRMISVNECGYEDLDDIGAIPDGCENVNISSFPELLKEMRESTDVKTLVIDSLSGVSQLMKDDILRNIYSTEDNPAQKYGSFSEGDRIHAPDCAQRVENAGTVLRNKGINVILLGHTRIEKSKNVVATDYQSAGIDMGNWARNVLTKWAQAVLFMDMDFKLRITKKWKQVPTEAKVVGDLNEEVARIIYTSKHPSHAAKNRLNLPTYIQMGSSAEEAYANFLAVLPEKIKENLTNG